MLTGIILAIILGSVAGTITGITPGVHINLVAIILLSISPFLLNYTTPIILVIFIVAMSVIHTFTNTIPAIYLGAPEEGTSLSVLPGHRMLIDGKGYEAVTLTIIGSLLGLVAIILYRGADTYSHIFFASILTDETKTRGRYPNRGEVSSYTDPDMELVFGVIEAKFKEIFKAPVEIRASKIEKNGRPGVFKGTLDFILS